MCSNVAVSVALDSEAGVEDEEEKTKVVLRLTAMLIAIVEVVVFG